MKNTEIILWVQGKSVNEDNILSHNGSRISKNDEEYMPLFEKIDNKVGYKALKTDGNINIYQQKDRLFSKPSSYIIHSNYQEKDVVGRELGFMSYIGYNNPEDRRIEEVIQALIRESKRYGYNCKESDIEKIKQAIKNNQHHHLVKLILVAGAVVIGLALVIAFMTFIEKNI